jgi:hypothetical protein
MAVSFPSPGDHQRVQAAAHHQRLQLLHGALEIVAPEGAAVVLPHFIERPQETPAACVSATRQLTHWHFHLCRMLMACRLARA